ncbi:MAG: putative metal-binding motif-containing protein [Candidatus Altiarchaeota archaeon]
MESKRNSNKKYSLLITLIVLIIPSVLAAETIYPVDDGHCYDWSDPMDGTPDFCQKTTPYNLVGAYYNGGGPIRAVMEFPTQSLSSTDSVELCVDHYHQLHNGNDHLVYADTYEGDGEVSTEDFYYPDNSAGTIFPEDGELGPYCMDVTDNFNDLNGQPYFGVVLHWTHEVEQAMSQTENLPHYWYIHTLQSDDPPYLLVNGGFTTSTSTSSTSTTSTSTTSTSLTSTSSTSSSSTTTMPETTTTSSTTSSTSTSTSSSSTSTSSSSTTTTLDCEVQTFYWDDDIDGYGNPDNTVEECEPPPGFVTNGDDCDDYDNQIYPGAPEWCNWIDDDCDELIDEGWDVDGDGWTLCDGDCDDNNSEINPDEQESCNGVDDDCDGDIDEGFDVDGDGYRTCDGDCDDYNEFVYPGATEYCDGYDMTATMKSMKTTHTLGNHATQAYPVFVRMERSSATYGTYTANL